jgi:hypothetical protein
LAVAAVAASAAAAVWYHVSARENAADRLKREIRAGVPVGSTREQVEAWAKEKLGVIPSAHQTGAADGPTRRTIPGQAGVDETSPGSVLEVVIPLGQYVIPGRGEVGPNHLWVFFRLNPAGEVTGHYFLTLEELARIEAKDRWNATETRGRPDQN